MKKVLKGWQDPENTPPPASLCKPRAGARGKKILAQLQLLARIDVSWVLIRSMEQLQDAKRSLANERNYAKDLLERLQTRNVRITALENVRETLTQDVAAERDRVHQARAKLQISETKLAEAQATVGKLQVTANPLDQKELTAALVASQLHTVREQIVSATARGAYLLAVPEEFLCLEAIQELVKDGFDCVEGTVHVPTSWSVGASNPKRAVCIRWGTPPFEQDGTKPLKLLGTSK